MVQVLHNAWDVKEIVGEIVKKIFDF